MMRTVAARALLLIGCLSTLLRCEMIAAQEPAKDAPPKIELTLPTTAKPSTTVVPVEEPAPTDELGQLLYAAGLKTSTWEKFADGAPLADKERRSLVGVFGGLRQLSPDNWSTFARPLPAAGAKLDAAARGKPWYAAGLLKAIQPLEFTDAELEIVYPAAVANAPGGEFRLPEADPRRKFFRCELAVEGRAAPVVVYALTVPDALRNRTTLDERAGVHGLYLKNIAPGDGSPLLAADRIAWFPRTPLGDLGVDYGLYDGLPKRSDDLAQEREVLFQLLGAMKKADFAKLLELTGGTYSVYPIFNDGPSLRGELVALEGQVRRAVPIVPGDELHRRFGILRYYEVAMFTAASEGNPILFNVLELPRGFPEGEDLNEQARIPGAYLTSWTYVRDWTPPERAEAQKALDEAIKAGKEKPDAKIAPRRIQFAPLLVGKSLQWTPDAAQAAEPGFNWWINGGLIVLIVGVVFFGWSTLRADRKAREIVERTNTPGQSLNTLPLEYRSTPDFSKLEEQDRK